jgi:hypothetical protein
LAPTNAVRILTADLATVRHKTDLLEASQELRFFLSAPFAHLIEIRRIKLDEDVEFFLSPRSYQIADETAKATAFRQQAMERMA